MKKYLKHISGIIPNTTKITDINLNGNSLIITGSNGSGKTSFLKELYSKIDLLIIQKKMADLPSMENKYIEYKNQLAKISKGTSDYEAIKRVTEKLKKDLDQIKEGLQPNIPENINFSEKFDSRIAIIRYFEAARVSNITHADTAKGIFSEKEKFSQKNPKENLGSNLEQHLVNLKNRSSLALTEDKNLALSKQITNWFTHFEKNLKFLMEDETTKLEFNSDKLKFHINQNGKPPYTFQSLSSGYSAIFDIYADLLLRTEYFNVTPENLEGIVFIDEIDAHLHVSLQRSILPFFERSFPCIQFIITTHSPFVLMSVNNATIFDLTKNQQVDKDLSLYSYSAVMEGLLGTKSTSKLLDELITEIALSSKNENLDSDKLHKLLNKVRPFEDKLDNKSKSFYLAGLNILMDKGIY